MSSNDSIAPSYQIILRDWNFETVAVLDSFTSLNYTKEVNGVGSYSLTMSSLDSKVDLFNLDYFVDIQRSVPGCGVARYREFFGMHRKPGFSISERGDQVFTSTGIGLNFILQGAMINYKGGTIRSYKNCSSNRAIHEYVEENCGPNALASLERMSDRVIPNLLFDDIVDSGPIWEGDRAFENLLDVITDIAKKSSIDFDIVFDQTMKKIKFFTYPSGVGLRRTNEGMDSTTGKNKAGNSPVVFSTELGNVASLEYSYDRLSEGNVVSVLGDSELSTRHVEVRESGARNDSPYNSREFNRPLSGFTNEMQVFGDEALIESKAKDVISIVPLLQSSSMYAKHFFLGDWISTQFRGVLRHRRIMSVKNTVGSSEKINLTFAEI